jgi:hypothetical protein
MATRERHQLVELNERLRTLRPKLAAALDAEDYRLALAYQREIDGLRHQRDTLWPARQHFYLMQQAASSPAAIMRKLSHRSEPVGTLLFFDPAAAARPLPAPAPLPEVPARSRGGRRVRR